MSIGVLTDGEWESEMRKAEPCPFYGVDCEYVPMAHRTNFLEKEIARLREALKRIAEDKDGTDPWQIAENALQQKDTE